MKKSLLLQCIPFFVLFVSCNNLYKFQNKCKIIFETEYDEIDDMYVKDGEKVYESDLPIPNTDRQYDFLYWNRYGKPIDEYFIIHEDTILEASWKQYYLVNYNSEYGTVPESKKVYVGDILKYSDLPILEDKRYSMEGWYFDSKFEKKVEKSNNYTLKSNITLYAKWILWDPDNIYQINNATDDELENEPGVYKREKHLDSNGNITSNQLGIAGTYIAVIQYPYSKNYYVFDEYNPKITKNGYPVYSHYYQNEYPYPTYGYKLSKKDEKFIVTIFDSDYQQEYEYRVSPNYILLKLIQ